MPRASDGSATVRVVSWNLFHGRDHPPEKELFTLRSRLLGLPERGDTHAQVNRVLRDEFETVLARDPWDLALLQEAPPRWLAPLGRACRASGVLGLTSRNWLAPLRAWIAERNPDLIASNEGGSNQVLARGPWRICAVERMTLRLRPERRALLMVRLQDGDRELTVGTLHATTGDEPSAGEDLLAAAARIVDFAEKEPLILGGDFNLKPSTSPEVFARLADEHGLAAPTAANAIDHILVRGLEVVRKPRRLPPRWRELEAPEGVLRLSDHAGVSVECRLGPPEAD